MRDWLGEAATTPAGKAAIAVVEGRHNGLHACIKRHGAAATVAVRGSIGHPVTPLGLAAIRGDTLAISLLLGAGADPHERANGHLIASPMAWAIESDSLGAVRLLVENRRWREGGMPPEEDWTDLAVHSRDHVAHPNPAILRLLLAAQVKPTAAALERAVEKGIHAAARLLLDAGADPNEPARRRGVAPIALAIDLPGRDNDESTIGPAMLKLLAGAGANVNAWCGPAGMHRPPALVYAIERGQAWAVTALLTLGADREQAREWVRRTGLRTGTNGEGGTTEALRRLVRSHPSLAPRAAGLWIRIEWDRAERGGRTWGSSVRCSPELSTRAAAERWSSGEIPGPGYRRKLLTAMGRDRELARAIDARPDEVATRLGRIRRAWATRVAEGPRSPGELLTSAAADLGIPKEWIEAWVRETLLTGQIRNVAVLAGQLLLGTTDAAGREIAEATWPGAWTGGRPWEHRQNPRADDVRRLLEWRLRHGRWPGARETTGWNGTDGSGER